MTDLNAISASSARDAKDHGDRVEPENSGNAAGSGEFDRGQLCELQLNLIPGIGPRLAANLLARFETAEEVLRAPIAQLEGVPGIGPKLAIAIAANAHCAEARAELKRVQEAGVSLYPRAAANYPAMLGDIPDPPRMLYVRGELLPKDRLAIAVVGSRSCTTYGLKWAESLSAGLVRAGITIVSGLARGIDAAAHRGALQAGGRTIAVFATGLGEIYPPEHRELADQIAVQGALVSEMPMLQAPLPGLFPQRNRIISGLSLGVLIIEAKRGSGALHTARHAMEQNREVYAVPGRIDSEASGGSLDLLKDGATLVRSVDDVLQGLGPLVSPVKINPQTEVHEPRELVLNDQERMVLNLVSDTATTIDEVLRKTPLEASRVLSTLTVLEMKRLVQRLPGGQLIRR